MKLRSVGEVLAGFKFTLPTLEPSPPGSAAGESAGPSGRESIDGGSSVVAISHLVDGGTRHHRLFRGLAGQPAHTHLSTSRRFQRGLPPIRRGRGIFPSAVSRRIDRGEMPRNAASPSTFTSGSVDRMGDCVGVESLGVFFTITISGG